MQESSYLMPIQGTRSIDPPSEHDLRTRISNQRRPKMQRLWRCRSVRQLDIIRHYNVGQHGFQHACSKETSRANIQSVIFSWSLETSRRKDHTTNVDHVQRANTRSLSRQIDTSYPHPPLLANRQTGRAGMHGHLGRAHHHSVWPEKLR